MADSDALRSRRKRLHAAGDHHLCRHRQVPAVVTAIPADAADQGENPEPAAGLRALAQRLEAAHKENPGDASLARVLKDTYLAIAGLESGDAGLEGLLGDLSAS